MNRLRIASLVAICIGTASAWANPLDTPACKQAVAQLEQRETAFAAARNSPDAPATTTRLAQARTQVARVCLQADADSAPASAAGRMAQPPVSVMPLRPAGTQRSGSVPSTPPAIAQPRPPVSVTTCDANGCWASDGSRLQRVGPQLLGPKGFCSTSGAVLNCP